MVPTTLACARPLPRRTACGVRGGAAGGGGGGGGGGGWGGAPSSCFGAAWGHAAPSRADGLVTGLSLTLLPSLLSPRWKSRAKASVNQPDLSEGEVSLPPGPPSGQG